MITRLLISSRVPVVDQSLERTIGRGGQWFVGAIGVASSGYGAQELGRPGAEFWRVPARTSFSGAPSRRGSACFGRKLYRRLGAIERRVERAFGGRPWAPQ